MKRMTATMVKARQELGHHEALLNIAREKYPGRTICPDCYLPAGMHRPNGGMRCELEGVDGVKAARGLAR